MLLKAIFRPVFLAFALSAKIKRRLGLYTATYFHRARLARVGKGCLFQPGVRFANPAVVKIGRDCYFWRGCEASAEIGDAPLMIGDHVQINRDVHLDVTGGLSIGAGTLISEEAVIYTHDHGSDPRSRPTPMGKFIGSHVWIGMRAVILPQCRRIGEGAIIGAGAVVTKDVPAGVTVAGNPARIVATGTAVEVAA
ncbi:acyltransferase [Yoonia sp. BS5-3]|uniref:Acyltransferase n=1 Tax=Yoonia phaeophyticola TaxID=3137369 RepID=A0ABZ2V2T0_9RHOB